MTAETLIERALKRRRAALEHLASGSRSERPGKCPHCVPLLAVRRFASGEEVLSELFERDQRLATAA